MGWRRESQFMKSHQLTRRTFLRAGGVAMALPLLDAMAPRSMAAASKPLGRRRLIASMTGLGLDSPMLYPQETGRNYTPSPYLKLLADFRDDLTIFSGVSHPDVDGGHYAEASFLTAAPHPA